MERIYADRIVTINVDIQRDFLPGGSLAVPYGDEVIPLMNTVNAYTREHNGTVIFTGDQHPKTTPHFNIWPVHCVAGTEGAAFGSGLDIHPTDVIINKGMGQTDGYSGFEGVTNDGRTIEQLIRPVGKERVLVLLGGLATEFCDLNTGLDALAIDPGEGMIRLMLITDAMRAINQHPDDGDRAIQQMIDAGAFATTSIEILTHNAFELAA